MNLGFLSSLQQHRLLSGALLLSLCAHITLLLLRLASPPAVPLRQTNIPLEIELVNARSQEKPKQAEIVAQANLNGGGDRQQGRARTPLPVAPTDHAGELVKRLQQRAQILMQEQRLLTQNKQNYHANNRVSETSAAQPTASKGKDTRDADILRQRLEAQIARDQQMIAKRPRRTQLTASSAMAVSFAEYYDKARKKIERYGTEHFPRIGNKPLYGSLVLLLNVKQDGRLGYAQDGYNVPDVTLQRSSGNATLDRQAIAIARATAPFGPFTQAMRAQYDILEIIYTFHFTRDGFSATTQAVSR